MACFLLVNAGKAQAELTYSSPTMTVTSDAENFVWVATTQTYIADYDETTFQTLFINGLNGAQGNGEGCTIATCPSDWTPSETGTWYYLVKYTATGAYTDAETKHEYYIFETGQLTNPTTQTRVVSFNPQGGQIISTSTEREIRAQIYVNTDEWNDTYCFSWGLKQILGTGAYSFASTTIARECTDIAPSYTTFIATSTFLREGTYEFYGSIVKNTYGPIGNLFIGGTTQVTATTSRFVVGTATNLDPSIFEGIQARIDALLSSTTANLSNICNIIGGNFNMGDCLVGLILPPNQILYENYVILRQMPPWGYAFRLYDIFSEEATSSIPVISATVPPGVIGAGATISLDANHALDFILNATSSGFLSGNATSTESFYDITSFYWELLVYIALALYILRRLLGTNIIHKQTIK